MSIASAQQPARSFHPGSRRAVGLLLILVSHASLTGCRGDGRTEATRDRFPLGDSLPNVALEHVDGTPVSLRDHIGRRPALIYIFGVAECASCSNLPLEFQIV